MNALAGCLLVVFSLPQQDFRDRIHRQRLTQSKIKENRQQIVRAQKYYDDYRVQLRAKMMRMRTREEMVRVPFCLSSSAKVNLVLCFKTNLSTTDLNLDPKFNPSSKSSQLCLTRLHSPAVHPISLVFMILLTCSLKSLSYTVL